MDLDHFWPNPDPAKPTLHLHIYKTFLKSLHKIMLLHLLSNKISFNFDFWRRADIRDLFRPYCHQDFVKKSDQVKTGQIRKTLSETTAPMSKHQLSNLSTLSTANQRPKAIRFKKEKIVLKNSRHCPFNKRNNYFKKFP